jgi:hypothetical protein
MPVKCIPTISGSPNDTTIVLSSSGVSSTAWAAIQSGDTGEPLWAGKKDLLSSNGGVATQFLPTDSDDEPKNAARHLQRNYETISAGDCSHQTGNITSGVHTSKGTLDSVRVSVIIPSRNAAGFLPLTLQSVLNQTLYDLEVIIVDDKSTDDTQQVVARFVDPRIRIVDGDGRGAAAARNRGLAVATGQLVMFLDADDILSPTKIALQTAALAGEKNVIATCSWRHFTNGIDEAVVHTEPCWFETVPLRWLQQSLTGGGMFQTACWLAPRALLDKAGPWDERLSLHDDGEYFCRVLLQCREIRFVPDCYVGYRRVAGSLSRQRSRQAIESAFRVCELRAHALLKRDSNEPMRRSLATQWLQFAYEFNNQAPDLAEHALKRLSMLQTTPVSCVGGPAFRILTALMGYRFALKLRHVLALLRTAPPRK